MSKLTVIGRAIPQASVRPLEAEQVLATAREMKTNGADDVIIKMNDAYHIASGRGLALRGVQPNDPVTLDGRSGRVVTTDRQLNSFTEGLLAPPGLLIAGGFAALGTLILAAGLLGGVSLAGLAFSIAAPGLAVGLGINTVVGLFGAARRVEPTR
jgi:hypothetical protein